MGERYRDIISAPKDGTIIRISGVRFRSERRYYAEAMWDTRNCPARVSGWFPPEKDGEGPYDDVDRWKPSKRSHKNGVGRNG